MTMNAPRMGSVNLRPLLTGLSAVLLLLVGAGLVSAIRSGGAVTHLQVEGDFYHVTAQAVRAAVEPQLGQGFARLDLDAVRAAVEALPWVERARVERIWPGDVRVRVWEREPFARWGVTGLLSTGAVPFTPLSSEMPKDLPLLSGPPGHEREVMEAFQRLGTSLAGTPFALASLALDARGEWIAQTRGGIELRLGRDAPDAKLDMITGPLTRALAQRLQEVKYVDLRYTNGFAVAWREPAPAAGGKNYE